MAVSTLGIEMKKDFPFKNFAKASSDRDLCKDYKSIRLFRAEILPSNISM